LVAETVRLVIGAGLAWAAAASEQITSPAGALAVGVAAPLIVERLTRAIPLTDPAPATAAVLGDASVARSERGRTSPVSQRMTAAALPDPVVESSQPPPVTE